jgi:hypothetical protein
MPQKDTSGSRRDVWQLDRTADAAAPPVRLLYAPYDSAVFDARMGAGPLTLARGAAARRLRERGHEVSEQVHEPTSAWRAELQTAFELQRVIAEATPRRPPRRPAAPAAGGQLQHHTRRTGRAGAAGPATRAELAGCARGTSTPPS